MAGSLMCEMGNTKIALKLLSRATDAKSRTEKYVLKSKNKK
jgi:hypothetical protein